VKFHTGGYSPQTHRPRRQVCLAGVIPAPTVELGGAEFRKFASQTSAFSVQMLIFIFMNIERERATVRMGKDIFYVCQTQQTPAPA
jgi:hypothetical protein